MPMGIKSRLPRVNQQGLRVSGRPSTSSMNPRLYRTEKDLDASAIVGVAGVKQQPRAE